MNYSEKSSSMTDDSTRTNSKINEMKKRHIEEMRETLAKYKILPKRENRGLDYNQTPNHCNIIIFGPSKSGKSSLIK